MVKKNKAQHQSEYLEFAKDLFQYAVALDNNDDDDILFDDELEGFSSTLFPQDVSVSIL